MTELAELIEDFRLETQFRDDYVYHVYNECDPEAGQRVLKRREYWKRDKHLGSGGFGSVWLEVCVDGHQKGRKRAVKDIQCPRGRVNYTRELEAIARFSKGLCARWYCQSFGWYEREDKIHLTMEYFPLGDLQSYVIRLSEPLPEADVQEISRQVFEGLDFMHKRNFAHRDIKPGNILLQSHPPHEWWVKISDFGLSKRIRDSLGVSSSVIGTVAFMAPEQQGFAASGQQTLPPCPKACDVWAVGAMAHLLLTKRHVFGMPFELFQYVSGPEGYLPARLERNGVPPLACTFIQAAMTVDPKQRLTAEQALGSLWLARDINGYPGFLDSIALSEGFNQRFGTIGLNSRNDNGLSKTFNAMNHQTNSRSVDESEDTTVRIVQVTQSLGRPSPAITPTITPVPAPVLLSENKATSNHRTNTEGFAPHLRTESTDTSRESTRRGYLTCEPPHERFDATDNEAWKQQDEQRAASSTENELETPDETASSLVRTSQDDDDARSFPNARDFVARNDWIEEIADNDATVVIEEGYKYIWKFGCRSDGLLRVAQMPMNEDHLWDIVSPTKLTPHCNARLRFLRRKYSRPHFPAVAFCPGAGLFAFAYMDVNNSERQVGGVLVIDMMTGTIRAEIPVPDPEMRAAFKRELVWPRVSLALSPDGTMLAVSGLSRCSILVLEVASERIVNECSTGDSVLYSAISFSHDNQQLAALGVNKLVASRYLYMWDLAKMTVKIESLGTEKDVSPSSVTLHPTSIAFLADRSIVVGFRASSVSPREVERRKTWTTTPPSIREFPAHVYRYNGVDQTTFDARSKAGLGSPHEFFHIVRIPESYFRNQRGYSKSTQDKTNAGNRGSPLYIAVDDSPLRVASYDSPLRISSRSRRRSRSPNPNRNSGLSRVSGLDVLLRRFSGL